MGLNILKLGFIGTGTVGSALAIKLNGRGYPVVAVSSRGYESARKLATLLKGCRAYASNQDVANNADLVFITTPDAAIPQVASTVKWRAGQCVIHCSGADSVRVLEPARQQGAFTGCCHPLQTFASIQKAVDNIPGSTFALEAEEPLLGILKNLVEDLDGKFIILKAEDKVAYHTAAVITSNYLVTLVKMATDLWQTFGVPRDQATRALLPLLKGTLNNIENIGIPNCLTGPIARGDTGTIQKHLTDLKQRAPTLVSAYRELGLQTIPIALGKGKIDTAKAKEMEELLKPKDEL